MTKKKLTLDDLVARKLQGKLAKMQIKHFDSKELGGTLEIRKISLKRYLSLANDVAEEDLEDNLDFMSSLIFECCPLFNQNSKQLMETYDCSEATELPILILNENMGEMSSIVEIISKMYGLESINSEIKNS